jgi:catechol 2,3-dioxygenase-like lactoylglutathione lyase family enzyme
MQHGKWCAQPATQIKVHPSEQCETATFPGIILPHTFPPTRNGIACKVGGEHYYAVFFTDPDGLKVEFVHLAQR